MQNNPPTMDVRVDGKIEKRTYAIVRYSGIRFDLKDPDIACNELVCWSIGDPIPTIIKVPSRAD